MKDPIRDAFEKPVGSIIPRTPAEVETVRRLMRTELVSLTTFFGFTNQKQADEYAEMFIDSSYTANQVHGLCKSARSMFDKMPSFKEMVSLTVKKQDKKADKEFLQGVSDTKAFHANKSRFLESQGIEVWRHYCDRFAREALVEILPTLEGIEPGYYTERCAMFYLIRGAHNIGRAIELAKREMM